MKKIMTMFFLLILTGGITMAINLADSYKPITWDIGSKLVNTDYFGKEEDSGRGLKVRIIQGSAVITPTTETLRLYCQKPDATKAYIDGVLDGDHYDIKLTNQVYAVAGTVKAELQLNVGGEWVTSDTFGITVSPNLVDASIVSSNDLIALQNALADVDFVKAQYASKADKDYVNTVVGNVASDTPKDTYDTLLLLQSDFPTGTTGKYIVGLPTEEKHWYIWVDGAWKDGGVYQGMGIANASVKIESINEDAFGFTGYKVLAGGSPIYVERVYDMQPYTLSTDDKFKVGYDFYTEDANAVSIASAIFLNNSPALNDYMGGEIYGEQHPQVIVQAKTNSYSKERENYIATYRYAHVFYTILPTVNQLTSFYLKNTSLSIGAVSIAPITGLGLIGTAGAGASIGALTAHKFDTNLVNYKDVKDLTNAHNGKWYGKKANFLSDSIGAGVVWNEATSEFNQISNTFQTLIGEKLGFSTVRSYGLASSAISNTSTSTVDCFLERYAAMDNDADMIVVFGGTNDFGFNTPLGTIADTTDVSFYGAVRVLMEGLINKYPGKRIVFMTALHRTGESTPNTQGKVLGDYNKAVKELAVIYSIPVIDSYATSGIITSIPAIENAYINDGLHPNEAGHALLANNLVGQFSIQ